MKFKIPLLFLIGTQLVMAQKIESFQPNWNSLSKHTAAPEWFLDAKFGIYFHWGVYSVPAFGSEWYPRNMHRKDAGEYKHHVATYGEPSEFGYHDFIPKFTAEHFNADKWVELFKKAGAKFAGPVAEHHDGFSMWASEVNPWNAKDRGPKRDIVGEMARATRAQGMKFVTSFHHAFNNQYPIKGYPTGYYPHVEGWPTASDGPELRIMYGNMPREEFLQIWKSKLFEVIDGYQPDLIWFDFVLGDIPEKERMDFLSYYFNKAQEIDKEVVVTYKGDDLPREVAVEDFEKGRLDHLTDYPWLTDDTISWGSWCYTDGLKIKSTATIVHTLVDIVSKNGVLLLNISPKYDGTIPEEQQKALLEIGEWLTVNGEAIYDTRPWFLYGEGPTGMGKSGHFVGRITYTAQDIRFTRSKDGKIIYAIILGWPEKDFIVESMLVRNPEKGKISLLGYNENIPFTINEGKQLKIDCGTIQGDKVSSKHAYVFKLTGFEIEANPEALFHSPQAIHLSPEFATIEGNQRLLGDGDLLNIGAWNIPKDRIHWLVRIKESGTYRIRGKLSTASGETNLTTTFGKEKSSATITPTDSWLEARYYDLGQFTFEKPGVYQMTLSPTNEESWKPVFVFGVQLAKINLH